MSKKFKLGVIGNPIEHSLSPFIHSRFAREQNLNIDYQAYKVEEGNFDNFISEFFSDKLSRGLNVTLPLKNLAANIEGKISEEAKFINAVNTITKSNRNFKLESTDGMGFMTDLKHKEIDIAGKNILIIGAGAAVESILFRLVRSEPSKINIFNRTKFDATISSGLAIMANQRYITKPEKKRSKISVNFAKYDNSGLNSEIIK